LDIVTLQILEEYLQDFAGCVIVVSHDRYFMDKIVDHLLVFEGNGKVSDFPGNYTQFRHWQALQSKEVSSHTPVASSAKKDYHNDTRRRMTYKEKQEYNRLTKEIDELEQEQKLLEKELCSGSLSVDELTIKSKRLPLLKDELDEKSFRWLELSELA
jgi:ATP-binding cassette subfamily F protein uup